MSLARSGVRAGADLPVGGSVPIGDGVGVAYLSVWLWRTKKKERSLLKDKKDPLEFVLLDDSSKHGLGLVVGLSVLEHLSDGVCGFEELNAILTLPYEDHSFYAESFSCEADRSALHILLPVLAFLFGDIPPLPVQVVPRVVLLPLKS